VKLLKEQQLMTSKNKVVSETFRHKEEEETTGCRKLNNKNFIIHTLQKILKYPSDQTIRIRWMGHKGERRNS
jgi:hypothetical protein